MHTDLRKKRENEMFVKIGTVFWKHFNKGSSNFCKYSVCCFVGYFVGKGA